MVKVISLGGSIVAPDDVNGEFLKAFRKTVLSFIGDGTHRFVLVTGGGAPARRYQKAYRSIAEEPDDAAQDWIGVAATRLNAELLRAVFQPHCADPVVTDPTADISFTGSVLVASGWKPGFSTDFDAVLLAERFEADTVINLSNIRKVYSADPKQDPSATPIDSASWDEFRKIVGDVWKPGSNLPFDPVAARKASELRLRVIVAAGTNVENLVDILHDRPFEGTTIGPG